jgi:predicted phage terminase large subunit-like protein
MAAVTAPANAPEHIELRPQPGPQWAFLSSPADIVIYGGQAGGGKTWGLLLEPTRHVHNSEFSAVIFRQTSTQIRNPGGLWDESMKLYPLMQAEPREYILEWEFPSGAKVKFAHLQHEPDKLQWQGAQIPFIGFDELTHFSETQFFYLLSRNRSLSGVRPYVRATTNPDADSWVAGFIAWWIDQETGYPITERAGVLRWFVRVSDAMIWADTPEELARQYPTLHPKSVTFIPASVHDNQKLMLANPEYLANLMALPLVERERLLAGNWKIRPAAGMVFNRAWFEIVPAAPAEAKRVRYWDKAATAGGGDWTVGARMALKDGIFYVEDVVRGQWGSGEREKVIRQTAESDGIAVRIYVEQEPGSSGVDSVKTTVINLQGYAILPDKVTGDKITRANPMAAQAQAGNVKLVRGTWNEPYLRELHAFPSDDVPDDQVDASSGAFNKLALVPKPPSWWLGPLPNKTATTRGR